MYAPISRSTAMLVVLITASAHADATAPSAAGDGSTCRTITVDGVAFDITARAVSRKKQQYAISFTIDARSADGAEHFMSQDPVEFSTTRMCRKKDGTGTGDAILGDVSGGSDGWDRATRITAADPVHWKRVVDKLPAGRGCDLEVGIRLAAFTFADGKSRSLELASVKLDVQSQPRIIIEDNTARK
jgi:hypothetical protein